MVASQIVLTKFVIVGASEIARRSNVRRGTGLQIGGIRPVFGPRSSKEFGR